MNLNKLLLYILLPTLLSCATDSNTENSTDNSNHQPPIVIDQEIINKYMHACSNIEQYLVKLDLHLGAIQNREIVAGINSKRSEALTKRSRALNMYLNNICSPKSNYHKSQEGFSKSINSFGNGAANFGRNLETIIKRHPASEYTKDPTIKAEYRNIAIQFSDVSDHIFVIIDSAIDYYNEVYQKDMELRRLHKSGE